MINISSPSAVYDGDTPLGAVADAIANNKSLASQIQVALVKFFDAKNQEISSLSKRLADNEAYQKEAISRAKTVIDSGDFSKLPEILGFAEKNFRDREIEKLLAEEAALIQRKQSLGL